MTIRPFLALTLAAAASACSPPAADDAGANAATLANDATYQRIEALPAAQQRAVFLRAILDADQDCQGVTASARNAEVGGRPAWIADCREGTRWLLVLQADGVMKVTGPVPPAR